MWVRQAGIAGSPASFASMTMLTPSSMAKIVMNFPSASSEVASHTHQLSPVKSP